ncbi:MAG: peptidoglycan editing factor PgeF [Blautia sp.]|nr:peptidoglycan editing factor PgeF [Blautia sp.]
MKIRWKNDHKTGMELREREGVPYLVFPKLDGMSWLCHGFSTRLGGVSREHLSSMNLSFSRGDEEANVRENFRRFGRAAGFSPEDLVMSDQTHTTNVRVVTEAERGNGYSYPKTWRDVDGMITDVPGLVLITFYADCVPLYIVDPVHRAVGLSHSGWRGTAGRIGEVTVQRMHDTYGSRPSDLLVGIGPSICRDCYEVNGEVIEAFRDAFPAEVHGKLYEKTDEIHYRLDLWEANREIFLEAGVPEKNIFLPEICTCCNPEFLFSHRASHGKRGNLAAVLGIRKSYE